MIASLWGAAQHHHYIYIQGDNQQNFYIRKGSDVISSSVSGFVILPKIAPGQQQLLIGFPKNEFPEYEFTVDILNKDRGFSLKNFNEKGWGLFDLQSLEVIMGKMIEPKKETSGNDFSPLTNDPFSVILASAVDDPRIRETSLVYREPAMSVALKPDTRPAEPAVNTETAKLEVVKSDPAKTETAKTEPPNTETTKVETAKADTVTTETAKAEPPKTETTKVETAKTDPLNTQKAKSASEHSDTTNIASTKVESGNATSVKIESTKVEPAKTGTARVNRAKSDSTSTRSTGLFKKFNKRPADKTRETAVVKTAEPSAKQKEASVSTTADPKDITVNQTTNVAAVLPTPQVQTSGNNATAKEPLPSAKNSRVVKYSEYERDGEWVMIYIDHQPGYSDTIRLSIAENENIAVSDSLQNKQVISLEAENKPSINKKGKESRPAKTAKDNAVTKGSASEVKTDSLLAGKRETRVDCKRMATEKDMVAMRKKMIMMADEDAMIAAAVRDIKTRCYSTERLQNLSYVFTTDKSRYKLFDAAYPYVYDPANYGLLERLLNDTYYIDRFKALIK